MQQLEDCIKCGNVCSSRLLNTCAFCTYKERPYLLKNLAQRLRPYMFTKDTDE